MKRKSTIWWTPQRIVWQDITAVALGLVSTGPEIHKVARLQITVDHQFLETYAMSTGEDPREDGRFTRWNDSLVRPSGTHAGSIFELFIHMLDPAVNKLGSSVSDDELVTNLLVVSYILSAAWKIRKVMQRLSRSLRCIQREERKSDHWLETAAGRY